MYLKNSKKYKNFHKNTKIFFGTHLKFFSGYAPGPRGCSPLDYCITEHSLSCTALLLNYYNLLLQPCGEAKVGVPNVVNGEVIVHGTHPWYVHQN
jgi:hypothetical protein